jgi:hypothetical protein
MAGISVIFRGQSRTSHSSAPPHIWTAPFSGTKDVKQ